MPFFQTAPSLGNQLTQDRVLGSYLRRQLPPEMAKVVLPRLQALGERAGGDLYRKSLEQQHQEPELTQWSAWGERIDRIDITPLWQEFKTIFAEEGMIATPYERAHGEHSRLYQMAMVYLLEPSSGVFSCPLAMTDGATKTLLASGNEELLAHAYPRLVSRDPAKAWLSGQWMTERTGGSDVAISETTARQDADGTWRLYGTKWFTSATISQMALTLARPEGNPPGGAGLALFFVELREADGKMRNIQVNRLKDKLGTRMVPTAELTLDGTPAIPLAGLSDGIKHITPMLAVTRTWNSVAAVSGMRRAVALARDYANRRVAFGSKLVDKPLHMDTLAGMQAETEAAFHLTFRAVQLLGKEEARTLDDAEAALLRLITPLAKLTTGKQAVAIASEALESFGGAGYIEDTGLPHLLRDAQVLPIWEGTTNVLSLDVLRALARGTSLDVVDAEARRGLQNADAAGCMSAARAVAGALTSARRWLDSASMKGPTSIETGARRFALTLGRTLALALLVEHAAWALQTEGDPLPAMAARRFARHGVDLLASDEGAPPDEEAMALGRDRV
jgi:alkylation response protein AidB-like acyl-CoA dehydrogenase